MENARLVRWLKQVGDTVRQGEPLLELETEKSVVEIEATESGRLVEILLEVDQEASVGERVGWLEVEVEAATGRVARAAPNAGWVGSRLASAESGAEPVSGVGAASGAAARIRSSPVARRLASEHALDLQQVKGTGPHGRVQLTDVRRALEGRDTLDALLPLHARDGAAVTATAAAAGRTPDRTAPLLSNMRRALARSMTLSNATIPQFNVERAVDWTLLQAARNRIIAELPPDAPRPSLNDFLMQAIARTLLAFPALNATFSGDANSPNAAIVPANGTHIGLVVAVDSGLLVPVFHNVEQLTLVELAKRRTETVDRALGGKLKSDELDGPTFSLSNLGARGPDRFTALINPPQSAILAVGRKRECVVANRGQIHVKPMSQLTLTVDHRVADGRLAADFLARLTELLEGETWQ
jgi:pyruvate dehydrogenase E2 component (dihydrolipoamide acetyltransferase)